MPFFCRTSCVRFFYEPMQINVNVDIEQATRDFKRIRKKQLPFAVARGLTKTAYSLAQHQKHYMRQVLHKPIGFTLSGVLYKKANYRDYNVGELHAHVYINDKAGKDRASYLIYTVKGGIRFPKKRTIPVPFTKNMKTNAAGNIPQGRIKKLLARPDTFQGKVKGIEGVWQRPKVGRQRSGSKGRTGKTGLKLLIAYEPMTRHTKKPFKFYKQSNKFVKRNIRKNMMKGFRDAIKPKR